MLTESDRYMFDAYAKGLFPVFSQWYFGIDPMPKQYAYHMARQRNVAWVGSIASGKSVGIAISVPTHCMVLPKFRALSTSITSAQAEIPFDMFLAWIDSEPYKSRLGPHIEDIVKRPYPLIKFKNGSSWLFRTAGYEATNIRGFEFDRIVFDEAGYEYHEQTINALRGRLRGERLPGVERMARLDAATSPTDNPWLRRWFERGDPKSIEPMLDDYISIRSTIYDNPHVSEDQIRLMEADYTDEMIKVELMGEFPDYGETMFPHRHIIACENRYLNDMMEQAIRPPSGDSKPGYSETVHPRHGITLFEMPYESGHLYVLAGDPGMGDLPKRNAGVVIGLDITKKPYRLVYFNWVSGGGSYMPFLNAFKYAYDKYHPNLKGIDATGTQRALDEIAFKQKGIQTETISFNRDKDAIMNTLSLALSNHDIEYPFIKGLHNQLSRYKRDDRNIDNDITVTLGMATWLARYAENGSTGKQTNSRALRRPRKQRSSRRYGLRQN